jgi:cellobiose-specific phosphotransferase system component IIC
VVAGIPMVALMIGYTVLSLWIIAQPIVVDPGTTPPSASASLDPI